MISAPEFAKNIDTNNLVNILKKHFNANPYGMMAAANGSYLADVDTDDNYTPDTKVVSDGYCLRKPMNRHGHTR